MENILTISQLNYTARLLLERELGQVWLTGEISNFSQPVSGHWYLTLKDENAQVRAAMFRMKNQRVNFRPQNGMQVLVRANISLYEPRGDYQIIIESMQPAGDGLLQQQFEQLKMKLAGLGLFAQEKKQPIPRFVKRVGIVTSSSGAALQDILNILKRRDPTLAIVIYPVLVQGKDAAQDIANTIALANLRQECDVLIVGRGGGSLEDLWCFNEEVVAYAIFNSLIPIISAVGHETDITIADFVADLRAPTPSAAAELVSRDRQELTRQLQHQFDKINLAFDRLWAEKLAYFKHLHLRLNAQHPIRQLRIQKIQFEQFEHRLYQAITRKLSLSQQQLKTLNLRLNSRHPNRQIELQRICLTQVENQLIQQISQLFSQKQRQWQHLNTRFTHSSLPRTIEQHFIVLNQVEQRLNYIIEKKILKENQRFQALCTQLEGLSPLKILTRGYSITQNEQGKILTHAKSVQIGDKLVTQFATGKVVSEIIEIK